MKLNVISVFLIVTAAALVGMVLGGTFGYCAGNAAPDFFANFVMWTLFKPVPVATVLGAIAGTLLGGALGVFGLLVQLACDALARRRPPENPPGA